MSDPAVESARMARMDGRSTHVQRVASAREALKPIRDLHYRVEGDWAPYCAECWGPHGHRVWPCATARLIYTSDELSA